MTKTQILLRLISAWTGIPSLEIYSGKLTQEKSELVSSALQRFRESNIYIFDSIKNLDQMEALCNELVPIDAMFVDFVQLIHERGGSIYERMSSTSLKLQDMATRLSGEFYRSHHADRHLWQTFHFSSEDALLVSPDYMNRIARKYGKDSDVYRVRVKGDFPLAEADTFIPLPLVEAARTVEQKPGKRVVWGLDPARFGDDETALVKRAGSKVLEISGILKRDTMEVAGWVANQAKLEKPDSIFINRYWQR